MWKGKYSSWDEAISQCTGYGANDVIEKTRAALRKVRDVEAAYERDTILYDNIIYSWPLLATLLKAAIENNKVLEVLDFGGSLGSSYYQNKDMLSGVEKLTWNIIDQPRIVEIGKEEMENSQLRFYSTIDDCLQTCTINVVLLSGTLQYIEKPHELLNTLISIGADYFIIDRTPFLRQDEDDILGIQYTSAPYYTASFPARRFNRQKIINHFIGKYHLTSNYFSYGNNDNNALFSIEGMLFKSEVPSKS